MVNDVVVNLAQGSSILAKMTVEELRSELAKSLTVTARHLTHIAEVWQELQRRGEDLSQLRAGLWSYMPLLASGMLDPELVVRYAGSPVLLRRLAELPRYEQDILLQDGTVVVVDRDGEQFVERRVPVHQLKGPELARVIRHKILTKDEQKRHLTAPRRPKGAGMLDVQSKGVAAARQRKNETLPKPASHAVTLRLTEEEFAALKVRAQHENIAIPALILGTLTATGLLAMPKLRKPSASS